MKKLLLLILCCFGFLVPACADILPLPEVDYSFIYNTEGHPLIDPIHSEQIQCQDSLCLQQDPLGQYGLQKLTCGLGTCTAVAYRFTPYQKLIIAFSDGSVRESNVFMVPSTLYTRFNVQVESDKLWVEPSHYTPALFERVSGQMWGAMLLILILELLTAVAYLIYTKRSFIILYSVAFSNIISTLLVWLFLPHWLSSAFILWLSCFVAEGCLIGLLNRKRITWPQAFQLSCAMNVTSYALGMILSFMFA